VSIFHRRWRPGGTYFFTLVTARRAPILCTDLARPLLRSAIAQTRAEHPFDLLAIVLLPDHLHTVWRLPPGDADYATRLAAIKARFTRAWRLAGGAEQPRTASHVSKGERAVWQRRFWEHTCRDAEDLRNHLDYVHRNPVKHGYVTCPHLWPLSTFQTWVNDGGYEPTWRCVCDGRPPPPAPAFRPRRDGHGVTPPTAAAARSPTHPVGWGSPHHPGTERRRPVALQRTRAVER
jgi:putative transposase